MQAGLFGRLAPLLPAGSTALRIPAAKAATRRKFARQH
jgi:hypothetical protein